MYDSEDETAATSTAPAPLKRGRKPRTVKGKSHQARESKVRQSRSSIGPAKDGSNAGATKPSNDKKPPESALVSQTSLKRITPTGKVLPSPTAEEIAKQQAVNREAERIARAASALDNRGNDYFERGYYDKAMDAYTRALKLKRRTFHSILEEADDLFDDTEDNDQLDTNEKDMDPKLLVSMATSINNIGYLRQRAGEATPDETMAAYKKSLRIKRKILGNDSLSVGKTLNNIGSVYYLKKEFDGAFPAYEEALHIMQSNLGEDHPDVATVISNMGDVLLAMKKQDESLGKYRIALNIRWNAFGEKDPRTMRLLEKIARIEIGDKMPTPRGTKMERSVYDWDESELYDLDLRPISHELRLLKDQLKEDLETVDLLEKKIAVSMVRDKIKIVRGMRELMEAQERENASFSGFDCSFNYDSFVMEDSNRELAVGSPGVSPVVNVHRDEAKHRVRERIAQLRIEKGLDAPGVAQIEASASSRNLNGSAPQQIAGPSDFLRSTLWAGGHNVRKPLSSMKPDEINDQADHIESALKLKKGIDNLRSFGEPAQKEAPEKSKVPARQNSSENTADDSPDKSFAAETYVDAVSVDEDVAKDSADLPVEEPVDSGSKIRGEEHVEQSSEEEIKYSGEAGVGMTGGVAAKILHTTWLGEIKD